MKLTEYLKAFLNNEVNLNISRIEKLDQRVEAISNFIKESSTFSPTFRDILPQGSYAHKTIIKPVKDWHEFDADLLLYIDEVYSWKAEDYVENLYKAFRGSAIYRDMVSRKTRCVTINYAGDFHIDVVPYLERHGNKFVTNRHENTFELTNPESYNTWLDEKNKITNHNFSKVLRLLKYLRDFKGTFTVKSIILNTLLGERVSETALLQDPNCYQDLPTTLRTIMNSIKSYVEQYYYMPSIIDPSGTGENFGDRWDQDGYANFRKWIIHYASKIEEAYTEPNLEESVKKWQIVFGDCFVKPKSVENTLSNSALTLPADIKFTEQQITDLGIPLNLDPKYKVRMQGRVVKKSGFRNYLLNTQGNKVRRGRNIRFEITSCTVPEPYSIFWKVLNRGQNALMRNCIRGEIQAGSKTWNIEEATSFIGSHYVECYIVKNGICVAKDRQPVNII